MLSLRRFSDLLTDLHQLDRPLLRGEDTIERQGQTILGAFTRHTPWDGGALYLRDPRHPQLRLAAATGGLDAPPTLDATLPRSIVDAAVDAEAFAVFPFVNALAPRPATLVPLHAQREEFGLLALTRRDPLVPPDDDFELLGAASRYAAMLLANQRMASEMRESEFRLKVHLWELESLYDIGLSITSTLDPDAIADEILIRTLSLLNVRRAALYLREANHFALKKSFGDVRLAFLGDDLGEEFVARLRAGEPVDFEPQAACIFPDCRSFIALPIMTGGTLIGILAVADRELRDGGVGPFEAEHIQLVSRFANQAAIALENARLHRDALEKQAMEREIELAATIQRDILPRALPVVPGFDIAAFSRPARHLGGDYHAFFEHEGRLSLCVADVAGKSVPAAVLVSAFHAALQLLFDEGRDLGEIATELNRHIHRWSSETKFITLVIATLDRETGMMRFVNAGHNPAYLLSGGGVDMLRSNGLPIGILPTTRYSTQSRRIEPGDIVVLYSDGITEAESSEGEEFGNERLETVLEGAADCPAEQTVAAIVAAVDAFTAGEAQRDDQTIVVARSA